MKKEIKFSFEESNYECILEVIDKENIKILIKEDTLPKFSKELNLKEIYEQIRAFNEYSMEEFFSASYLFIMFLKKLMLIKFLKI